MAFPLSRHHSAPSRPARPVMSGGERHAPPVL